MASVIEGQCGGTPVGRAGFYGRPRFFFGVGAMLAALVLVNIAARHAEPHLLDVVSADRQFGIARIADHALSPRADVVFMGSSLALNGLDPRVAEHEIGAATGARVRALNLAIAGSAIDLNLLVLKNIIADAKKPRVIVYGLADFEMGGRETFSTQPFSSSLFRLDDFSRYGGGTWRGKTGFLLDRFLPAWKSAPLARAALGVCCDELNPSHEGWQSGATQERRDAHGFFSRPPGYRAAASDLVGMQRRNKKRLASFSPSESRLRDLGAFLDNAQRRGIEVVLVIMPVTGAELACWPDEKSRADFLEAVRQTGASRRGVVVEDFYTNAVTAIPDEDFVDLYHLNQAGASTLTRLVSQKNLAPLFGTVRDVPAASQDVSPAPPEAVPERPEKLRASVSDLRAPNRMESKVPSVGSCLVANTGTVALHGADERDARLMLAWKTNGKLLAAGRVPLRRSIPPGATERVYLPLNPPPATGDFILEVSLISPDGAKVAGGRKPSARKKIRVDAGL